MRLVRAGVCRCVLAVCYQGAESGSSVIRVESIGDVQSSELASLCRGGARTNTSLVDEFTRMLSERVVVKIEDTV